MSLAQPGADHSTLNSLFISENLPMWSDVLPTNIGLVTAWPAEKHVEPNPRVWHRLLDHAPHPHGRSQPAKLENPAPKLENSAPVSTVRDSTPPPLNFGTSEPL